ncbi:hypothetical protein BC941DRAFT_432618 [Chlamydoabsidia padenii]|nr:hypothetical protein BC941DRAFT_432618 [Chlamydoabsidia padenii]
MSFIYSDLDDQYIPGGVSSTVSVFGYPPEMVTDILTYFKQFGDISATTETAKNCVTITYTTPQAAQKAVEANGKVLPNNTMVGVTRLLPADIDRTPSNTIIKNNNSTPVDPSIFKPSSSSNGILGIFSSSEPSKPVPELTKLGQPVVKVGQENLFDKIKKYALTGW